LEDCLSSIQTAKPKLLNVIPDKTHSEHFQGIEDEQFRQNVQPKVPIVLPKTSDSVS